MNSTTKNMDTGTTIEKVQVSIVVPTYNERENIPILCEELRKTLAGRWTYEIIVVDDNSPDGTGEVVRQLAQDDPAVRLLHRPGKLGLGSAVVDGFQMAKGDYWVMMDADLSHRPQDLLGLLDGLADADIVVGSRYVDGGGVMNWPLHRRLVSRGAATVGRLMVGLDIRDTTSGFGAFRKTALEPILPSLNLKGFKLLLEILANSRGAAVTEAPVTFVGRHLGKSKMSIAEVSRYIRLCIKLWFTRKIMWAPQFGSRGWGLLRLITHKGEQQSWK